VHALNLRRLDDNVCTIFGCPECGSSIGCEQRITSTADEDKYGTRIIVGPVFLLDTSLDDAGDVDAAAQPARNVILLQECVNDNAIDYCRNHTALVSANIVEPLHGATSNKISAANNNSDFHTALVAFDYLSYRVREESAIKWVDVAAEHLSGNFENDSLVFHMRWSCGRYMRARTHSPLL
jgi:hypothetical protein